MIIRKKRLNEMYPQYSIGGTFHLGGAKFFVIVYIIFDCAIEKCPKISQYLIEKLQKYIF